ncbi:hypothetical protein V491_06921 [Pseudogymnoascus sp. VKM F-3775]|nr:hypothetical protein V491_06921 [Pseudogymnoascus sp. VKM F-3775]
MMTRRYVRAIIQLSTATVIGILLLFLLDSRFRVLPASVHTFLPAHHAGLVITDVTVKTCSTVNLLTSCKSPGETWHRIEKDLYLGTGWVSSGYVFVERKKEEDLLPDDKIVVDLAVSRLVPTNGAKDEAGEQWESRPAGIWIKRSGRRHASDSNQAVTSVDVLFGPDAVEPRKGWEIKDTALLLDSAGEKQGARLSIRRGKPAPITKTIPRINENGKFKILQVADLHLSTGVGVCRDAFPENHGPCEADTRTLEFIGKILDDEKPDLVVLSGDQVNGDTAPDAQTAIFKFAELFIKRKIPYATIFGNHDDEKTLSRAAQMDHFIYRYSSGWSGQRSLPPGPKPLPIVGNARDFPPADEISGVGNYYVEILARGSSKHSALTLYLLDTHAYTPDERKYEGYDWLKQNQIDWFKSTAQGLKKAHREYTKVHMDLAFIHIPLPEYVSENMTFIGEAREGVTAPAFNSGFRDALVEEGVLMVSCGHDHANDYCGLSMQKDHPALWMCYGGGSGFGGYGGYGGYHRRVRLFDIDMNEARVTTYKRLEYGETEKRIDEQIIVEGGKVVAPIR